MVLGYRFEANENVNFLSFASSIFFSAWDKLRDPTANWRILDDM